jgi:hypothetical protein
VEHDEEPLQPESPLLGDAVQLDDEETLEGDPEVDPLDSGYVPPDRPVALDDFGTTLTEEREGESLDRRLAREEPDVSDEGEGGVRDPRAGRIVAEDEGIHHDEETDLVGMDVGIDGGAASAEEAAVHEWDENHGELSE